MKTISNILTSGNFSITNKEEGISIALNCLMDSSINFEDRMASVCYLGYRLLDGTYTNKEYFYKEFEKAKNILEEKNFIEKRNIHRWKGSHKILLTYIKLLTEPQEPFPEKIVESCFDEEITNSWPSQAVNVLRAGATLYHHYKDQVKKNKTKHKMIKIYDSFICNEKKFFTSLIDIPELLEKMNTALGITRVPYDHTIVEEKLSDLSSTDIYFYKIIDNLVKRRNLNPIDASATCIDILYAEFPEIGIPLAQKNISVETENCQNYISSVVYLGYRLLDGTYKNFKDHKNHIDHAFCLCKKLEVNSTYGYRWILSLTLLKTYMSAIMNSIPIIEKNLLEETYSIPFNHESQLSNYCKLSILVALSRKKENMKKEILDMINKYDLSKQEHMSRNVINDLLKPYLEANDVLKRNEVLKKYEGWYIYKDFIKTIYILEK